jgi:hypothetical protein
MKPFTALLITITGDPDSDSKGSFLIDNKVNGSDGNILSEFCREVIVSDF